uniref:Uncharacterized protein n=1 Tax=Tetranychus urticae TaxID=32264 RepID=T1K0B0_TETUR
MICCYRYHNRLFLRYLGPLLQFQCPLQVHLLADYLAESQTGQGHFVGQPVRRYLDSHSEHLQRILLRHSKNGLLCRTMPHYAALSRTISKYTFLNEHYLVFSTSAFLN